MKEPINIMEWPLAKNLNFFSDKSFEEIASSDDSKFKKQLKQNALKIVSQTNKSFQEKVDAWQYMRPQQELFDHFFKSLIRLALSEKDEFELTLDDRYQLLTFFNHAFNSIEIDFVHQQIRKYLPLSIWINLSKSRRSRELAKLSKRIRLAWKKLEEQDGKMDPALHRVRTFERTFIFKYMKQFIEFLNQAVVPRRADETMDDDQPKEEMDLNRNIALYCQRFIEFVIDVESQLPLRRFFHSLMESIHLIVRCQLSSLAKHKSPEGHLFAQLVELLHLYSRYKIDIMSGDPLSDVEILKQHEQEIMRLQKSMWSKYADLKKYATKPVKAIDHPSTLYKIVTSFDNENQLFDFVNEVGLIDCDNMDDGDKIDAPLLANILISHYRRYESQLQKINSIPLFPNESVIWDTNLVPDQYYNYEFPLALPKLNLQFLTMSDYLLRNFMLFKNESTYEIRQDIEEGVNRSKCRWTTEEKFATGPKQRMALIIKSFSVTDVQKPRLGEKCPAKVSAKVVINMDYVRPEWRREWEQLRKHDTCFLVSFKKPSETGHINWPEDTFPARNNVKFVRGCEIEALLDSDGKVVDENLETPRFTDNLRTYLITLDSNQYRMDQDAITERKLIVYNNFHLIVRRKPEKNNFKGVLETIRDLINTKFVVPDWLRNLLIGFGNPSEANPSSLRDPSKPLHLDYFDTFVDFEHLSSCFKTLKPDFVIKNTGQSTNPEPPYRVIFDDKEREIQVSPYVIPPSGLYETTKPRRNNLRFTPAQVDAITSGLQHGLTMVVGPPGTGKTDVAVQILSSLYHSYPDQRTLIVTHSNQALNQIFSKMIDLDVEEHHLLRMGHGEEDLDSARDFSRQGRIKHVLTRRKELLASATKLAKSLGLHSGQDLNCQSAGYFFSYHIEPRWKKYQEAMSVNQSIEEVKNQYPFTNFFQGSSRPLFNGQSLQEDIENANNSFRFIKTIFDHLRAFRPFEIFNNASDRSQYLLIREAKIIAMTCTHAGLRRKELVEMNFQYDNILMEETAQILEVETTIPLLLQNPENGVNRLKRWIMIGDHNQLPPIIQNSAFQRFSNMEQSLFARFVRLGVPYIELDAQGRARKSICDLYRWRYRSLKELSCIQTNPEYNQSNAGFLHEYQLIDIGDHKGVGESTPVPYYYQNRGEAEFAVALYKYMRIIGYPPEKITILTTYNGQKQLIRDLIEQECTNDAYIGRPHSVATVDKFQGQQNDYIILSLVRTKTVGHLRDIRRLVVAMSRARLGLYILARVDLFRSSLELQHSMRLLLGKPVQLTLVLNEKFPSTRPMGEGEEIGGEQKKVIGSVDEMQQLVAEMYTNFMDQQARNARLMDDDSSSSDDNAG